MDRFCFCIPARQREIHSEVRLSGRAWPTKPTKTKKTKTNQTNTRNNEKQKFGNHIGRAWPPTCGIEPKTKNQAQPKTNKTNTRKTDKHSLGTILAGPGPQTGVRAPLWGAENQKQKENKNKNNKHKENQQNKVWEPSWPGGAPRLGCVRRQIDHSNRTPSKTKEPKTNKHNHKNTVKTNKPKFGNHPGRAGPGQPPGPARMVPKL